MMNMFTYIWKRVLFRRFYWQPEEIERSEKRAKELAKRLGIRGDK